MSNQSIGDYGLLCDLHGAALVDRRGRVQWCCLPRFDSPAVFAAILDPRGGQFGICTPHSGPGQRRYLQGTLALATTFEVDQAKVELVDTLAVGPNHEPHGHHLGRHSPHLLVRRLRCIGGRATVEVDYQPRPEYGLITPLLLAVDGGIIAGGGAADWVLSSPIPLTVDGARAFASIALDPGRDLYFGFQYASTTDETPAPLSQQELAAHFDETLHSWRHWSSMHQSYDGPWRDLVHLSGRVLQGLTFYPTGAIVAAPTTSLPEEEGGQRNWDYRYSWIRDASFTLDALWVAACPDEAYKFIEFLTRAALAKIEGGRDLQVLFGVAGEHDLSERKLDHLAGWRGSAPVRVGNAAWRQFQLDIYGEIMAAVDRLQDYLDDLDETHRRFLVEVVEAARRCWRRPDQGIWETRTAPRHYLYSKLMCWLALDRGVVLADWLDAAVRKNSWRAARDEIGDAILSRGWSEQRSAFVQCFDDDALDASALVIPMIGFLPGRHPRVVATLDAVEEHLTDERGLLRRYRADDGLTGEEGSFLLCTFWLAHARALAGQTDRAKEIFERAIAYRNDLDLLAEEVDSSTGEALGNFPQAFSHIGLINAAWAIHQAGLKTPRTTPGSSLNWGG